MVRVFISYRRSDTQMVAGRLRESLARRLGHGAIFRDKDSIGAGEDWTKAIEASLGGDVVVLALIGPSWETARDEAGGRRLDDPADWNRVELEQALKGSGRVIPLLVDGAKMPTEAELPESLRQLARSNALKLRDDDWDSDIERLSRAIGARGNSFRLRRLAVAMTAFAVIVGGGASYWWLSFRERSTSTEGIQTKEQLYTETIRIVASLANLDGPIRRDSTKYREFWTFYKEKLLPVESSRVEGLMVEIGRELEQLSGENKGPSERLRKLSFELAPAMKEELR